MPRQKEGLSRRLDEKSLLARLRKVQAWRRARLQLLVNDPDIDINDPGPRYAIKARKALHGSRDTSQGGPHGPH
ncbi:hypothetical protein AC628_00880 [Bradyrhizobium sp. NAS96.2]|nr:hypothetical protein AC628_00880 [Bradyrhizobium sp. NAS96.2]